MKRLSAQLREAAGGFEAPSLSLSERKKLVRQFKLDLDKLQDDAISLIDMETEDGKDWKRIWNELGEIEPLEFKYLGY